MGSEFTPRASLAEGTSGVLHFQSGSPIPWLWSQLIPDQEHSWIFSLITEWAIVLAIYSSLILATNWPQFMTSTSILTAVTDSLIKPWLTRLTCAWDPSQGTVPDRTAAQLLSHKGGWAGENDGVVQVSSSPTIGGRWEPPAPMGGGSWVGAGGGLGHLGAAVWGFSGPALVSHARLINMYHASPTSPSAFSRSLLHWLIPQNKAPGTYVQIEWKIPEALPSAGSPGLSTALVLWMCLRVQMADNWTRKKIMFCP